MILKSTYKGDSPTKGLLPEAALNRKSLFDEIRHFNESFFTKLQKCNDSNDNYYY